MRVVNLGRRCVGMGETTVCGEPETAVVSTRDVIRGDDVWEWMGGTAGPRSAETAVVVSAYVCGANRVWGGYLVVLDYEITNLPVPFNRAALHVVANRYRVM